MIEAFIAVAKRDGINKVTRELVGEQAECCPSLINYYFGSMCNLLDRAAWQGVEDGDWYFVKQLFSINHESVNGLDIVAIASARGGS